jgi:hypothetical protein
MRNFFAGAKFLWAFAVALALSGCIPSTHPPERLYPIAYEMDLIRNSQADLASQYSANFLSSPAQAKLIRNEVIAQRMYAIDVQYTLYENALTRETQEVGFGALTTAEGLSTAATLVAPVATKTILSAAATAVLAIKGHYDSEVLLAQAMRNIQKQMRASRNMIAAGISAKLVQSVSDYPLSAALSDLEEYYAAGTLTSGVIDSSTTVGIRETDTKNIKQDVTQAPPALRAAILRDATAPIVTPSRVGSVTGPSRGGGSVTGPSRGGGSSDSGSAVRHRANFDPTSSTDILEKFLDPTGAGVRDPARSKIVTDLIAAQGLTVRLTRFLNSPEFATQRAAVVKDLPKGP